MTRRRTRRRNTGKERVEEKEEEEEEEDEDEEDEEEKEEEEEEEEEKEEEKKKEKEEREEQEDGEGQRQHGGTLPASLSPLPPTDPVSSLVSSPVSPLSSRLDAPCPVPSTTLLMGEEEAPPGTPPPLPLPGKGETVSPHRLPGTDGDASPPPPLPVGSDAVSSPFDAPVSPLFSRLDASRRGETRGETEGETREDTVHGREAGPPHHRVHSAEGGGTSPPGRYGEEDQRQHGAMHPPSLAPSSPILLAPRRVHSAEGAARLESEEGGGHRQHPSSPLASRLDAPRNVPLLSALEGEEEEEGEQDGEEAPGTPPRTFVQGTFLGLSES